MIFPAIKYEVTGELYDSYEKRLLYVIMPYAAYCDLNTGEFQPIDDEILHDSTEAEAISASGHQWTTTAETISHPSTGHYETVTKKEAFCGCGASGFQSQEEINAHWENDHCGATTGGVSYSMGIS